MLKTLNIPEGVATPELIKADLKLYDRPIMYLHGLTAHPRDDSITTQTASIFADTPFSLESAVEEARAEGWQAYIIGTMADIPAAYLYKEIENDR